MFIVESKANYKGVIYKAYWTGTRYIEDINTALKFETESEAKRVAEETFPGRPLTPTGLSIIKVE